MTQSRATIEPHPRISIVQKFPLIDSGGRIYATGGIATDITERTHIRQALQLQVDVLHNMPAAAWTILPDGRCDFVNRFFLASAGLTLEQCLEPTREPALPPLVTGVHPDYRDRAAATYWKGIRDGLGWTFEAPVYHTGDRSYHWHFDRAVPLRDTHGRIVKFVGTSSDVEELRQAQAAMLRTEERARAIVDTALDAVVTIDRSGIVTGWNEQAVRIFGWSRSEAVGRRMAEMIIPPELREAHDKGLERFLVSGEGPILNRWIETTGFRRDGHRLPIELTVTPLQLDGRWAFSAFLRDITEQKGAEAAQREARAALARITRLTTMGELAASIAHEIKQPLAAITTNGETCMQWLSRPHLDGEKVLSAVQRILSGARRASAVIDRIRALINKSAPDRGRLDINDVVREVITIVHSELAVRDVSIRTELSDSLPPVIGDRVQLQQVLLNLIINGIEAMANVTDRPRIMDVTSARDEAASIRIAVHDTGIGFEPRAVDRLFDAFYTTKPSGMGMGLSICRSIVEAHGGRLLATPRIPVGASFEMVLPTASPGGR